MSTVAVDIQKTIDLIESKSKKNSDYSELYSFTTENLNEYLPEFEIKDKEILTVLASGDQVFNLILLQAKKIVTFDINKLSYYYYELKKTAIKKLRYDEFLEFFMIDSDENFNCHLFDKLQNYLLPDVEEYWEAIFKYFEYSGHRLRLSNLFNNQLDSNECTLKANLYLNEDSYRELRNKLDTVDVSFINLDIKKIEELDSKYDYVIISNLTLYIEDVFEKNYLKEYAKLVKSIKSKLLKKSGNIIFAYIYDYNHSKKQYKSDIENFSLVKETFKLTDKNIKSFDSTLESKKTDAILFL